jgi:N-acetylneuraminic acid mutarotase
LIALAGCDVSTSVAAPEKESLVEGDTQSPQSTSTLIPATEQIDPLSMTHGEWVFLASMQISRSEYSIAAIDGQIYAPGGFAGGNPPNPSNALERYDPGTNTWEFLAILPKMRHHAMVVDSEGDLFLFGGDDYSGRGPDAWIYDPLTDEWQTISPMPIHVTAATAVVLDEHIYVFGGLGHLLSDLPFNGEVQRYDPRQDQWEILSTVPVEVNHCTAVALDGEIYVIGGRDASTDYSLVQIYDPQGDTWREGEPLQLGRAGHAAVVVDGLIYVLGGERINSEDYSVLDSVEIFDPSTQSWSDGVPMPVGLHGVPAVEIDGTIFVVGGSELANGVENHGYLLALRP